MKTNSFDKVAEQFANLVVEKMQQIKEDWHKPWISSTSSIPRNITGRMYAGANLFFLLWHCEKNAYKTPVFLTFNQAKERNISILRGVKAFPVYYFLFAVYHKKTGEKITLEMYKELPKEEQKNYNVIPTYKYYSVFNLDQTNFQEVMPDEWNRIQGGGMFNGENFAHERLDSMLDSREWVCPIQEKQSDEAYYNINEDYIVIPRKVQFEDGEAFYETLLHEMGHSTGHPDRLNRNIRNIFGTPEYGREELVAELSAAMAGMLLGINEHIRPQNVAYLKNWIEAIAEEPRFILNVLADVTKVVQFILEKLNISLNMENE